MILIQYNMLAQIFKGYTWGKSYSGHSNTGYQSQSGIVLSKKGILITRAQSSCIGSIKTVGVCGVFFVYKIPATNNVAYYSAIFSGYPRKSNVPFFYVCISFMINDTWFKFAFDFTPFLTMVQLFMLPVESGLLKFQYKTNLYLTLMS